MALPSSPPPLSMGMEVDELPPSSPPLPTLAVPPSRKRQLSEYDSNISSDPLFSEGTTDSEGAGVDGPRRKRMVRGPWWSMGKRPQREGSALKDDGRNVDSGIWMGSDGSEGSLASALSSQRRLQALRWTSSSSMAANVAAASTMANPQALLAEQEADVIINNCVEHGNETIDLSRLALQGLSSETLRPLHQLIRHAHISMIEPPSEDQFTALTPELKLFLANNELTSLPSELFLLENMTVLSLRNNKLSELPHSIGWLTSLKELNIAGNQIRYLPFELLTLLGRTKQVNIRPNPLVGVSSLSTPQRFDRTADQDEDMLNNSSTGPMQEDSSRSHLYANLKLGRCLRAQQALEGRPVDDEEIPGLCEELIYLATSEVRYFDVAGLPCRKSAEDYEIIFAETPMAKFSSEAPSLFELVLQCAQRECDLRALPSGIPKTVDEALKKAARAVDARNQRCTTCQRGFIIPRAEWMEFWFSGPCTQTELNSEAVLPFLRTACSWACAKPSRAGTFR